MKRQSPSGALIQELPVIDFQTDQNASSSMSGTRQRCTSAAPVSVTVAHGNLKAGDAIEFAQAGTGQLTLVQGTGASILFKLGKGLKLDGQNAVAALVVDEVTDVLTTCTLYGELIP